LADLSARLAVAEDELADCKTRNNALVDSLRVAQALHLCIETHDNAPQKPLCQQTGGESGLVAELRCKVAMLEEKVAAVVPLEDSSISSWLDDVRPGYGVQFAKAFKQAGYEDLQDLSSIPQKRVQEELDQLLKILRWSCGAKMPQERRIQEAVVTLVCKGAALPVAACNDAELAVGNISIKEWLENIQLGFGGRFAEAFAREGYEVLQDLAQTQLKESEMNSICFHLKSLGAKQPQLRQIFTSMKSLSTFRCGASVAAGACTDEELQSHIGSSAEGASEDEQFHWAVAESLKSCEDAQVKILSDEKMSPLSEARISSLSFDSTASGGIDDDTASAAESDTSALAADTACTKADATCTSSSISQLD